VSEREQVSGWREAEAAYAGDVMRRDKLATAQVLSVLEHQLCPSEQIGLLH